MNARFNGHLFVFGAKSKRPIWAMALEQAWQALKETLYAHQALFTFLCTAIIYIACEYFIDRLPPEVPRELRKPELVGEITEEELRAYDGSARNKPLLVAIKGQIYDVSWRRSTIYGPGMPYSVFLGRDASRAFAKGSFEEEDITGDISGLDPDELKSLDEWDSKYKSTYVKVGTIKKPSKPESS